MKKYSNTLITFCFLLILITLPSLVKAQPDPGGDPDAPIDGGLGILLAAGVGYGVKKYREHKKQLMQRDHE
ncbi:MAG: hypothetical protein ABIN97_14615 [Ginsengibacter sp.]